MPKTKVLPKSVKVGGSTYKIGLVKGLKEMSSGTSLFGCLYSDKNLIEIEAALSVERQWQVLWHELMHAFLRHSGYFEAHDEAIIEALSHQINWVLVQNGQNMLPNA